MNKFNKISTKIYAKNLQFLAPLKSCGVVPKAYFASEEVGAKPEAGKKTGKYSDKYELSEQEIQSILKKPKKRPNILAKTQVERGDYKANYEKSIEEQLGPARFNTVKEWNTKIELAQKIEITAPEIKPSDRPDVKYYKYDLPIPNIDPEIEGLDDIFERERMKRVTPNQNMWQTLELTGDADFNAYETSLQKKFNFELDMYGDITNVEEKRQQYIQVHGEAVLPTLRINNPEYMETLKNCFSLNINMPGTLENEDPNKFIRGLRPVEEFRHTPLIPISDKRMAEHKEKLEAYHRGGLYFEVKKETIANYAVLFSFCFLGYNLFSWLMEKEEEVSVGYERMKLRRLQSY